MSCSAICRRGCSAGAWRSTPSKARAAIEDRVAAPLGLSLEDAARGILAIVDNNMVGALRVVSVERGHDPRDFTLAPFGGAGPLHGCALAALLGITRVLIPPAPGVLCADGLLAADLKAEFSRTLPKAGPVAMEAVEPIFVELERQADDWLAAEGVADAGPRQAPRRADALSRAGRRDRRRLGRTTRDARSRPHSSPRIRRSTASLSNSAIELVTVRIEATGRMPEPRPPDAGARQRRERRSSTARCISRAGVARGAGLRPRHARRRRPLRRAGDHHAARRDHVRGAGMERGGACQRRVAADGLFALTVVRGRSRHAIVSQF